MISRHRFSLTFAILASLASLLLLTWLLLSIISFKTAEKDLIAAKTAHGSTLLKVIISSLPETSDGAPFDTVVSALSTERDFSGIVVINERSEQVYRYGDERPVDAELQDILKSRSSRNLIGGQGQYLLSYAPVIRGGEVKGAVRLSLSLAGEYERLARSRTLFLGYFVLDFILLLGLGAFMLRRIVVSPLDRLLKATERVIEGDYSHPVSLPGSTEIAGLADSFNLMQNRLRERRDEVETHLKALQQARLETIRSEKMASVGLLAAGMAHEIGAPLAGIIGYSGIMAEELADDPEKSDYLRRIAADAARIDRLVRDLLNYARPVKPEIERIDVREFLEDLFSMLERQGAFKRLETELSIEDDLPALYLDRHQLMQVLMNLVMNARDAMTDGGRLSISASCGEGESVLFAVTDSGSGILPENMEKIFDPFFTTKEPGKGTGLGLAISARLVETFGGSLKAESSSGKGTTFYLKLPGVSEGES